MPLKFYTNDPATIADFSHAIWIQGCSPKIRPAGGAARIPAQKQRFFPLSQYITRRSPQKLGARLYDGLLPRRIHKTRCPTVRRGDPGQGPVIALPESPARVNGGRKRARQAAEKRGGVEKPRPLILDPLGARAGAAATGMRARVLHRGNF